MQMFFVSWETQPSVKSRDFCMTELLSLKKLGKAEDAHAICRISTFTASCCADGRLPKCCDNVAGLWLCGSMAMFMHGVRVLCCWGAVRVVLRGVVGSCWVIGSAG